MQSQIAKRSVYARQRALLKCFEGFVARYVAILYGWAQYIQQGRALDAYYKLSRLGQENNYFIYTYTKRRSALA